MEVSAEIFRGAQPAFGVRQRADAGNQLTVKESRPIHDGDSTAGGDKEIFRTGDAEEKGRLVVHLQRAVEVAEVSGRATRW